jgi:bifunctional isochorismate lyase/aryl carrier protein
LSLDIYPHPIYINLSVKETYFTSENIAAKAGELLRDSVNDVRSRGLAFEPGKSALLVLDMQPYFLDPDSHACVPSARAIIPVLQALVEAYRQHNLPVIFTRHVNSHQDAGMMSVWWRDLIGEGNPLSQILPDLEVGDSPVITKPQYDAFYGTNLEEILRQAEVRQVLVSGVMTHLCCETTARSAFMRGFEVFFLVDGTATYNEAFHLATLLNLSHGFATLTLCVDVVEVLENVS